MQTRNGGPEVLEVQERPDPPVGPGEVRVAVKAAGINFADTMARVGLYPDAPKPPCVVGYEVAGEIESVGEGVTEHKLGDRVVAGTRFGGHAELVTVPEGQALPLDERFSFEQGAAIPVNYVTAWAGLVTMGGLEPGDRVLIHAAGGGVGTAATQIAKGRGAEVFGTASASKHEAISKLGVDHAIDYRTQDFAAEIMRITDDKGVDIAFDATGPTNFKKDYKVLRPGGCLIMYGLSEASSGTGRSIRKAASAMVRGPFATFPWWKSLNAMNENKGIFGLNMLHWQDDEPGLARLFDPMVAEMEAKNMQPVVAEAFPFDRAGEAHEFIAARKNIGKVVLVP